MLKYCLIPFFLTTFVGTFNHLLSESVLTLELIFRIYFALCTSYIYISVMYINLFSSKPFQITRTLFISNIISMINYMNGKTFIPTITQDSDQILIDNIIFMLFTCSNILTISYIIETRLLQNYNLNNYFDEDSEYEQTSSEDDNTNQDSENDVTEDDNTNQDSENDVTEDGDNKNKETKKDV